MSTIAIIDFAHSGTTMLAGICEILGVPMVGDYYQAMKWEDLAVIHALQSDDEAQFAELVEERNGQHETWGFKFPGAWKFAPMLKAHLRDPVYLAIYKDPVSVTRRRFGKGNDRWLRKVRNTARQMRASVDGIYASGLDVHVMSYYKAITTPGLFVQEVAAIAGKEDADVSLMNVAAEYIQPNLGELRTRYPEIEPWISPF